MSSHADSYPALAESTNLQKIKNVESGFSNHRYPYIKASNIKNKSLGTILRDGDIVFFTTATKGLDITHVGIITIKDGVPMLIHASSKEGKVTTDPL